MNVWHFLGLWLLLSIVLGPLIGACIQKVLRNGDI